MEVELTREWCEHCRQYVKKRTKRQHRKDFFNPVTKVWKKTHHNDVHSIDDAEFQFSSTDEEDNLQNENKNTIEENHETQNISLRKDIITSDESDLEDPTQDDTTASDSSTDISDQEEWLDMDYEELLKHMRESEMQPIYQTRPGELFSLEKKFLTALIVFLLIWKCMNIISNNAFEILLGFLKSFLQNIGTQNVLITGIALIIPTSVYKMNQLLGIDRNDFSRYIVCQNCLKLFEISICSENLRDRMFCDNIPFQRGKYGQKCNTKLVREIVLKNGDIKLYPCKLYCFKSIINTLEDFLCRPGFEAKCEEWRYLPKTNLFSDVYDGQVWKDFLQVDNKPFLSQSHNFAFIINVDWFQPYERRKDISIGVIYMVLLNLPRHLRYKRENIVLIGIIPNLKKEPKSLNTFLEPLVKELKHLWKGVLLKTYNFPEGKAVRAALLCAAADIPAARKLCGFLGHTATFGCSKCMKKCSVSFGERNYGGFDKTAWTKRTHTQHMTAVNKLKKIKTKTGRENMESKLGYRYSVLLDLSYMNCVRFCIIDPMHNLFLGTAKHIWKLWVEQGILSEVEIKAIETRIEKLKFPSDIGRLPNCIASNWGGFTAQQWKTWTLVVSLYALPGLISEQHLKMWHTFVRACQKICHPIISESDANIADKLFLKFGNEFETLFGSSKVTPNIHLHCHLLEVIKDFGSVYGFWLFSFERYNGLLGNFCNNKRDIEIQIMREFLSQDQLYSLIERLPSEIKKLLELEKWIDKCKYRRTINYNEDSIATDIRIVQSHFNLQSWSNLDNVEIQETNKLKVKCFDEDDSEMIRETYKVMYENEDILSDHLSTTYTKIDSLRIGCDFLSSKCHSQSSRSKYILSAWRGTDGKASLHCEIRPCRVKHFIEHTWKLNGENASHVFAVVEWYKKCDVCNDSYPDPVSVWFGTKYENASSATFLPVQKYVSKFVFGPCNEQETNHIVVTPLSMNNKLFYR